jgi:hypothetical protein
MRFIDAEKPNQYRCEESEKQKQRDNRIYFDTAYRLQYIAYHGQNPEYGKSPLRNKSNFEAYLGQNNDICQVIVEK